MKLEDNFFGFRVTHNMTIMLLESEECEVLESSYGSTWGWKRHTSSTEDA